MDERRARQILLVSFIIAIGIITWSELHDYKMTPRPKRYVGAGLVYGILGVAAPFISYQIAALFGIGMVGALLYQKYHIGPPSQQTIGPILRPTITKDTPNIGGN